MIKILGYILRFFMTLMVILIGIVVLFGALAGFAANVRLDKLEGQFIKKEIVNE